MARKGHNLVANSRCALLLAVRRVVPEALTLNLAKCLLGLLEAHLRSPKLLEAASVRVTQTWIRLKNARIDAHLNSFYAFRTLSQPP